MNVVRHAVSLDERRSYFVQNLWGEGQDVVQVWFPGVHCDVGGGYVESEAGLSKIALKWLLEEAESHGLKTNPGAKAAILPAQDTQEYAAPNAFGQKHESLEGWWWIPELLPRRIKDPANNWTPTWIWPLGRPRTILAGALMHSSIFTRQNGLPDYRPRNIPTSYTVVP